MENDFYQFIYFDTSLNKLLLEIKVSLINNDDTDLKKKTTDFESKIRIQEQKIIFSYDSLLYCSLLLIFISITVIMLKIFKQKNELAKIQVANENQLKFRRDLHDGVAQDLAALKIYLVDDNKDRSIFYADRALKEVRYLIDSMHIDLSKGFDEILKENLENFEESFGIETQLLIICDNINRLSEEIQIELLRILQEALSNIARHANASLVEVRFTQVGEDLNYIIKDNGKGFSIENLNIENDSKKHYGVVNIQERVKNLNGTVDFICDGGTSIAICFKNIIHR